MQGISIKQMICMHQKTRRHFYIWVYKRYIFVSVLAPSAIVGVLSPMRSNLEKQVHTQRCEYDKVGVWVKPTEWVALWDGEKNICLTFDWSFWKGYCIGCFSWVDEGFWPNPLNVCKDSCGETLDVDTADRVPSCKRLLVWLAQQMFFFHGSFFRLVSACALGSTWCFVLNNLAGAGSTPRRVVRATNFFHEVLFRLLRCHRKNVLAQMTCHRKKALSFHSSSTPWNFSNQKLWKHGAHFASEPSRPTNSSTTLSGA